MMCDDARNLVSIVVPVYNVEDYLAKCIESILSQTYENIELVLVDDGSKDDSGLICDQYAERDSRIKVFHQLNQGVSAAREYGFQMTTGEYIMFVDADDYISKDAVEYLLQRLITDETDMAVGQILEVAEERYEVNPLYEWMKDAVWTKDEVIRSFGTTKEVPMYLCGKLYKKRLIKSIYFAKLSCCEDAVMIVDLVKKSEYISLSNHTVYFYVQHENSATHSYSEERKKDAILARVKIAKALFAGGYVKNAEQFYNRAIRNGIRLKDADYVKTVIKTNFSWKERCQSLRWSDFTVVYWFLLHCAPLRTLAIKVYDWMKHWKQLI